MGVLFRHRNPRFFKETGVKTNVAFFDYFLLRGSIVSVLLRLGVFVKGKTRFCRDFWRVFKWYLAFRDC
jgi:hypothetical protein